MLLSRSATRTMLGLIALAGAAPWALGLPSESATPPAVRQQEVATTPDSPPANCPVTLPSDKPFVPPASFKDDPSLVLSGLGKNQFWFGTSDLWTILPIDGVWRAWQFPSRPGDFAYSNKIPWFSKGPADSAKDQTLTVTGKRLDGPAPSFAETQDIGIGGISIPVFGCWQVTAHFRNQNLIFTVWVVPPAENAQSPAHSESPEKTYASEITPRRLFVDAERQAKFLVYEVMPETPADAHVSGSVVLHTIIGTDGRPRELQYVSGPSVLAQAAIEAAKWWQYRVELVDEQGVEVDTTIEVTFPPSKD